MPRCKYHNTKFKAKYFLQKYCLEDDECREAERNYRASLKPIKIKEIGKSDWKEAKRKEMNAFLKTKRPIPKVSQKQVERLAQYRKVRDQFMKEHPNCQARLDGCTIKATDTHHAKGKVGDLLTDKRYFKALCRSCHSYIEINPNFAKEKGFSLNRLEK